MRICLLTSTSIRHAYLAKRLAEHFDLRLIIREKKGLEKTYDDHPDVGTINNHFRNLASVEKSFFPDGNWETLSLPFETVDRGGLNLPEVADKIRASKPDIIVLFGCGLIKESILEIVPQGRILNIHQGLSPYYRGSGTNFWPFVEGHLEYIGVTLHAVELGTDTGGIIAHARPDISESDSLHEIGCKTIVVSADILNAAILKIENGDPLEPIPQWSDGKLYKRVDVNGEAIRAVHEKERQGFVGQWCKRNRDGRVEPVRLVTLS